MSRRRFLGLAGVGGFAAGGIGAGLAIAAPPVHRVDQLIDEIRMYVTHYAFFEEPDPEIPAVPYLDALGRPDHSLELVPPIGEQVFVAAGHKRGQLVQARASFKTLPYLIAPPGFSEMPAPPQVIGALQAALHLPSAAAVLAHLDTRTLAIGQFALPPPSSVTGLLSGAHNFSVTKDVRFRVQIKLAWVYDDGASALGILSPSLTNAQVAAFLGVDAGPTPSAPLAYEWAGAMTLDTRNHYRRRAEEEPPPVANAFEPDLVKIDLRGEKIDDDGHYTLVGSVSRPQFLASPFASLPAVLSLLFGTTALTDMELAYAESGRLIES